MKTTLKEIGIFIGKGIIYLVSKIINAEIDTEKIRKVITIIVVVVVLTLFGFLILYAYFSITAQDPVIEQWRRQWEGRDPIERWQNWQRSQESKKQGNSEEIG